MRVHLLGLAHVPVTTQMSCCAYTAKVCRLCAMLRSKGHEVVLYGAAGSDESLADDFVECLPLEVWQKHYGGRDTTKYQFKFDVGDAAYREFDRRAAHGVLQRCSLDDPEALFCTWGLGHAKIAARMPANVAVVEPGIGYKRTFAPFRVFESYAWMQFIAGMTFAYNDVEEAKKPPKERRTVRTRGMAFDAVIPQAFDPAMFEYREEKGDYWLYMGRINKDKGYPIAMRACEKLGEQLLVVGQLREVDASDALRTLHDASHVEYRSAVGPEERKELLAGAKGLFALTQYIEPFGGVAVEAQLSGTPVVCTDWGAFPETVPHGRTGWRCRSFGDILFAMRHIERIKPGACRSWAERNFSITRVAEMYDDYLSRLVDVKEGRGWAEEHPERAELDWLTKALPVSFLSGGAAT